MGRYLADPLDFLGRSALLTTVPVSYGGAMRIRKGMRVRELSKRVGQPPRRGRVIAAHAGNIEVRWDDGHRSSVTGSYLFPEFREPD
jgi:hypothetical protein